MALLYAGACIGTSPEQRAQGALGDDDREEGPTHRPGQPCLLCHSEFAIAGTVYMQPTDATGVRGAEVVVVDGLGREIVAVTNSAGNFYVGRDAEREEGGVRVGFDPVLPFLVRVRMAGVPDLEMESLVWRDGSCASCHALDGPHEASEPRVYAVETP
jgi:hypothetical protein